MSTKDPAYVAEQTGQVLAAIITDQPLEPLVAEAKADVVTAAMGACVVFDGIVRDHDSGQRVKSLTYTSHPTAQAEIERVAAEVSAAHPRTRLYTAHRVGALSIGDSAFVVIAAAAHRGDAFAACSEMADRVKAEVPIWKEQTLLDGTATWVGLE
ncbi:molybdenum cofactor biosynthesis protein MoaE [Corynebacterium tapiri]|uniref:Molybdenum cofactor biosynthesis protein MoaE n=1 Tax=Corynebacterium tapiri TaxID=1448266 RepID=A0A5C4U4R5_9CORY|nr:molybdenum cofactor biosynthesis protein MoaE [Corynebacterium tapiri]TNL97402.1 molybdenum cofactor biosynthesis protein MoaE [Corynebacterium tapiri]